MLLIEAPDATSGRRQPSRDCACLLDCAENATDPCRRRARPLPLRLDGMGVFSSGEPIGQIHLVKFGVGCDLLIRCLPISPTHQRHPVRVWPAPRTCPGHVGQQQGLGPIEIPHGRLSATFAASTIYRPSKSSRHRISPAAQAESIVHRNPVVIEFQVRRQPAFFFVRLGRGSATLSSGDRNPVVIAPAFG